MWRKPAIILFLALMLAGAAVGSAALRPAARPSGPIQAAPLQESPAQVAGTTNSAAPSTFQIQPGASTVNFTVDEILRGSPNTVVGTTDQVTGQIGFDPTAPENARVGTIRVNARALATDDASRNRMISNFILSTDQYEYITFDPTRISGLPESATPGTPYTFQIDGDLTIRDVVKTVTFTATVAPVSDTELKGTAGANIRYTDWGISIPQVPSVAGVDDDLQIQIDFVATPA